MEITQTSEAGHYLAGTGVSELEGGAVDPGLLGGELVA